MSVMDSYLKNISSGNTNSNKSVSGDSTVPTWLKKIRDKQKVDTMLGEYNKLGEEIAAATGNLGSGYVDSETASNDKNDINSKIYKRTLIANELIYHPEKYGLTQEQADDFKKQHESTRGSFKTISDYTTNRANYFSNFSSEEDYNQKQVESGYYNKYKDYTPTQLSDALTKIPEGSAEYKWVKNYKSSVLYNEYTGYSDEKMAEIEAEHNKYYDPNGRYQTLLRKSLAPQKSGITDAELRELSVLESKKDKFEEKYDYNSIVTVRNEKQIQDQYIKPYLSKSDFNAESSSVKIGKQKENVSIDEGLKIINATPKFALETGFTRAMAQATKEEKEAFVYVYNTKGEDEAKKWYDAFEPILNRRASAEEQQSWKDFANENPFNAAVSLAASLGTNIIKGGVAVSDVIGKIAGVEIDPYDSAHNLVQYAPVVRQEVSKDWGPFGSYAFQLGMSLADFGTQVLLSKGIGKVAGLSSAASNNIALGIMGTGAAADTITTAKLSGATDTQAIALGFISGAIEVMCEKASIETLFGSSTSKLGYAVKNAFTEATEEGISSVTNIIADMLIMADKSEIATITNKYLNGFTDSNGVYHKANTIGGAFASALVSKVPDVALDAFSGLVSGGLLSIGGITISHISANKAANNIINKNNVPGLVELGLEMPKDSKSYSNALALQEQIKNTTPDKAKKTVAQLVDSIRQESNEVLQKYDGEKNPFSSYEYVRAASQLNVLDGLIKNTDNVVAPNQDVSQINPQTNGLVDNNVLSQPQNVAEISAENDLTANLDTVATNIKNSTEGKTDVKTETINKPEITGNVDLNNNAVAESKNEGDVEENVDTTFNSMYDISRANKQGDLVNDFYNALTRSEWRNFYTEIGKKYLGITDIGTLAPIVVGNKLIIAQRQYRGKDAHDYIVVDAFELQDSYDGDILESIKKSIENGEIIYDERTIGRTLSRYVERIYSSGVFARFSRDDGKYVAGDSSRTNDRNNNNFYRDGQEGTPRNEIPSRNQQDIRKNNGIPNAKADTVGSASFMPETKEPSTIDVLKKINADDKKAKAESGAQADVSDSSKWSSPRSRWETEKTEAQKEAEKNQQKESDSAAASSLGEIVSDIEKAFGVSISTGRIRHQKARGIFWVKSEAIRTRVTNALPTISHELGHWFDKKFKLNSLFGIEEVIKFSEIDNPGFLRGYKKHEQPGEAVAEFVRMYLQNTERAKAMMPSFYSEFVKTVPKKELAKLDEIAQKVNKYMSASAIVRDRAAIITREKARRKSQMEFFDGLKDKWKNAVTKLLDKNEPIKDLGKEAYLAAMQEINSDGIVRFNIESGMSDISGQRLIATDGEGNKIQAKDINGNEMFDNDGEPIYEYEKSLSGVIDTIFDYYNTKISKKKQAEIIDDFSSYLVMRHAPSWLKSGKRVFADDTMNNLDYVNKQKAFYEQQYPQFEAVAEELNRWQKRLMQVWLVDTGYITKEFYEKLWQMYPNYVPLNRDVDSVKGKGKINTVGTAKSAVMRAKGSGADILNPIESIALQVDRYVKNAEKNKVRQEIANAAKTKEGIGHLIEKVPPNMVAKMVPASEMESALRGILEFGAKYQISVDTIGDQIGAYLEKDALQWTVKGNQGEDIMVVLFDGKKEYYQIHDEMLFNAINSLNYRQTNAVVNIAKAITRFKKTVTTGSNPIFALTNGARDFYTGFLYGSESNIFKYARDHFMAVWDIIKKSNVYTDYEAVGGTYQSSIAVAKEMTELSRKLLKRKPNARATLKAALGLIENLTEAVELAPRLAEYKRTLEEGASQIEALYAASEITVNFKRSGEIGRSIDAFVPYFNASIQGMSKIARAVYQDVQNIKEADGKKAKLKAVTESFTYRQIISSTILAAIVLALNGGDDDKEEFAKLSSYTKNNYYCFHIGNGKFIKIPKAKELAFLESVMERTWEATVWGNDKAFTDFADYMSNLFVPPGMLDPFALMDGKIEADDWMEFFLNPVTDTVLIGTMAEMWANENFTGSPIVPSYLEDLPAEMQYNESTTWFAKQIGKMFNMSPMMVDHFFDSNTGVIWDIMQSFAENRPMALITSKFTADNAYSSDVLNNFYDRRDELAEEVEGNNYSGNINGETQIEYSYYTSANSVISVINSIKKQAETPQEERMLKIVARDYADYFMKNYSENKKLAELYKATKSSDILPSKKFSNEYTITVVDENGNKVQRKITLSTESFMNYVANYNTELQNAYDEILSGSYTDAEKVAMIKVAKSKIDETLKLEFANQKDGDYGIAKAAGISVADFSYIISSASTDGNSNVSQKEARDILDKSNLSKEQKAVMWNIFNSSWKNNPFGKSGNYEYTANTNNDLTLILKKAFGNN